VSRTALVAPSSRPPAFPPNAIALALDVGGTKVAGCLVRADGTHTRAEVIPTLGGTPGTAEQVWARVSRLIRQLLEQAGDQLVGDQLVGVGIGSAGPVDPADGTVSPVNIPAWVRFPLAEHASAVVRDATGLAGLPVRLAGDGLCAAVGEHWRGAGVGADNLVVLVVSTGVGGGIIQAGRPLAGRSGNAGHVGHAVVDLDGDPCPCGGTGCVESIASGPSMVRWARRQGWAESRDSVTAHDLAADARAGDAIAIEAFRRAGRALAAGIVSTAAIADVDRAVIGGGVANAGDVLIPPLREALGYYAHLPFLHDLQVVTAELGGQAGLVGAGGLVIAPDRYRSGSLIEAHT
jgi:glucokinase